MKHYFQAVSPKLNREFRWAYEYLESKQASRVPVSCLETGGKVNSCEVSVLKVDADLKQKKEPVAFRFARWVLQATLKKKR